MRNAVPQCARLLAVAMFAAACNPNRTAPPHGHLPVKLTANCSATQIKLVVDPSTATFPNTNGHAPTDVDWSLDPSSDVTDVSLTPDDPTTWPFNGTPPFKVTKGAPPYSGVGKPTQATGHNRYSVTVTCNGMTVIFDPDIWVD
jgi:hypothetical protein